MLRKAEMLDLIEKLRSSGFTEFRMSDVYREPTTRAKNFDVAIRALTTLEAMGKLVRVKNNRWKIIDV